MKTSEILIAAKERLWSGCHSTFDRREVDEYICNAINHVKLSHGFSCADMIKLRALIRTIEERLDGQTFRNWLNLRAGVPWDDLQPIPVQAHRLAWMDTLIAEYEAEGD